MKISKAKFHGSETYNDYEVELSWGQLQAIYAALENNHADPLADELYAELGYYLANVPGPGEDEEEYKQAKDAEKQAIEGGEMDDGGPNQDLVGQEVEEPAPGQEFAQPEGAESPSSSREPHEEEAGQDADRLLERPPESHAMAA